MKNMLRCLIVMLVILAIFNTAALAQQKQTILPYKPAGANEDDALEKKIKEEIDKIKNSGYYQGLLKFVALRAGSPSLCNIPDKVEDMLPMRYFAEGRCSEMKNAGNKQVCEALVSNECDQLSDWSKSHCVGLQEGDVDLLIKVQNHFENKQPDARAKVLKDLGIYRGFKYYSVVACERYMQDIKINNRTAPLCDQLSCQILFSPNVDTALAEIMRYLAILIISKNKGDSDMCQVINNSKIKEACLSPSIKTYEDIFTR